MVCRRVAQSLVLLERAAGVMADMRAARIKPDRAVWNALITAAGRAGQLQRAFQSLEEMQARACAPHVTLDSYLGLLLLTWPQLSGVNVKVVYADAVGGHGCGMVGLQLNSVIIMLCLGQGVPAVHACTPAQLTRAMHRHFPARLGHLATNHPV